VIKALENDNVNVIYAPSRKLAVVLPGFRHRLITRIIMKKSFEVFLNHPGRWGLALVMSATVLSFPLVAQETAGEEVGVDESDDLVIEEVMVTGVRRSLTLALDNKRNSDTIMDGIASEGIGKFPDLNLAESLSRVTGVQIDYSGPGGERREGQIAIRGLPNTFARTLVNGQTLATPNFNGGFAFSIFESDIVSAVNVIKSQTAAYDEGGLSGIVDIRTLRPLSISETFLTAEIQAGYEELSGDTVPSVSASWAQKFADDRLGVYASVKWSDQSFRTDSARINGYDDEDTDGDGFADIYIPNEARYNARYNEGGRLSFAGGIEFQASDNIKMGLLGVYSAYDIYNQFEQLRVQDPISIEPFNLVDGGKFGDTYTQAIFHNPEIDVESRVFDDQFSSGGLTGDIRWDSQDWTAIGVAHYSKASYDRFAIQSRRNIRDRDGNGMEFFIDTGAGNVDKFLIEERTGDWLDPAWYSYGSNPTSDSPVGEWRQRFLQSTGTDRDEQENALQFDLIRHFDGSFFSSVDGGLKWRKFQQDQKRPRWSVAGWDFSGVDDLGVMVPGFSNNGSGYFGGNLGGTEYLVPDWEMVKEQLLAINTCEEPCTHGLPASIDNSSTFETDVDISAIYLMTRFDGMNTGMNLPIRGNIGVRYIKTKRDVSAYTTSDLLEDGEQESSAKYDFSNTLPSMNLIWDIRENLMLRGALYKAMVRSNANAYRVSSTVDVNWDDDEETIPEDVDIELGNPFLEPFTADSFDLSLEWYHREGSGLSLAYFYKDIQNGIEDRQLCPADITDLEQLDAYDFTGIITGSLSMVAGECVDEAGVPVLIQDSINNDDNYTISGWEFGLLHNFDHLPGAWSGLGVRFNFTFVDTDEGPDFDSAGNRLPLENVSKETYNFITYYDAANWGVRLAYTYRSDYFLESNDTFTGDDRFVGARDRWDLSGSWRVNDWLRLRAEIFNLTDERRVEYQGLPTRVRDIRYTGRVYTLSAKFRIK